MVRSGSFPTLPYGMYLQCRSAPASHSPLVEGHYAYQYPAVASDLRLMGLVGQRICIMVARSGRRSHWGF